MSWLINFFRSCKQKAGRRLRLNVWWRKKLDCSAFEESQQLFRSFAERDLDANGKLDVDSFTSKDQSVNWSRFSIADDVLHRENVSSTERIGCYSFTVKQAKHEDLAIPCHDPLTNRPQNYAHTEVRWLRDGELQEPEKGRRNSKAQIEKSRRLAWKAYVVDNLQIEISPK